MNLLRIHTTDQLIEDMVWNADRMQYRYLLDYVSVFGVTIACASWNTQDMIKIYHIHIYQEVNPTFGILNGGEVFS